MNRRHFLQLTTLAAGSVAGGFPSLLRARGVNEKLNVGFIGLGGQGKHRLQEISNTEANVVALCDADEKALALAKKTAAAKNFAPKTFVDYRELLQADLDAVVIATPDHWHAPITTAAMKSGKHVFCEKPLTHTISEARAIRDLFKQFPRLVTQMGNQGSASINMRRGIEVVQAGAIGPVREVHVWIAPSNSFKPGQSRPVGEDPVPAGLHWNNWIGPAAFHAYKTGVYHPKAWRAWYDFGGGSMADWGCHGLNFPFRSLKLDYPIRIEPDIPGAYTDSYPVKVRLRYDFAARGDLPPVTVWWYDGGRPPADGIVPKTILDHFGELPPRGCLLLGKKGFTFGDPANPGVDYIQLAGETKLSGILNHAATKQIPESLPRTKGHLSEWVQACTGGPATFSNFETGGHLTEIALSGVVAVRAQKALVWNGPEMRAENAPETQTFIQAHYRKDWI